MHILMPLSLQSASIQAQEDEAGFSFNGIKTLNDTCNQLETVQSKDEFLEWLQSSLFRPHFMQWFENAWLLHMKTRKRTDDWKGIQRLVAAVEQDNPMQYTSTFPDRTDWSLSDWNVRLLLNIYNENINHTDGILQNKPWMKEKKLNFLYWIVVLVRAAFAPSRVTHVASGGYTLLALTLNEIRHIHTISDGYLPLLGASSADCSGSLVEPSPDPSFVEHSSDVIHLEPTTGTPASFTDTAVDVDGPKPSAPAKRKRQVSSSPYSSPRRKIPDTSMESDQEPDAPPMRNEGPRYLSPTPPIQPSIQLPSWEEEILTPKEKREITKISETLNMKEPWWQVRFINVALLRAKQPAEDSELNLPHIPTQKKTDTDILLNAIVAAGENPDEIGTLARTQIPFGSVYTRLDELSHNSIVWDENLAATCLDNIPTPDRPELIAPTQLAVDAFNQHQQWFDSHKYQREDHDAACSQLGIANPTVPKIPGMRRNVSLRFWQPVAIKAIQDMARNPLLKGCVLADAVGLGKTWTTAGYLLTVRVLLGEPSPDHYGTICMLIIPRV